MTVYPEALLLAHPPCQSGPNWIISHLVTGFYFPWSMLKTTE